MFRECTRAPGPGSRCMFSFSESMRIPAVLLFWVMVTNLPPPVPRKMSSSWVIFISQRFRFIIWVCCDFLFSVLCELEYGCLDAQMVTQTHVRE